MPSDVLVTVPGTSAAPLAYSIAPGQEIVLKAGFAAFDGSAAGNAFLPCLRILDSSGEVVGQYITDSTVAAGSSADVSFAPFLSSLAGGTAGTGTPSTVIDDISFVGAGTVAEGVGVTSLTVNTPAGLAFHDLLIVVLGFENVAAGSGPYVSDTNPAQGWFRILTQAPVGGNGTGLEVWAASWEVGASTPFNFFAAQTVVAREVAYRNTKSSVATAITITNNQSWAGNNPVCPSVTTTIPKSWVVPVGALALAAGTMVYPGGYTRRFDNARAGASGNAEIAEGDGPQAAPGASGTITLTAAAAGGTARGGTATLVLNPNVTTTASTLSLIGLTVYTPAADSTINSTTATALTAIDATNGVLAFTVPSSGAVLLRISCLTGMNNNSNAGFLGFLDGATKVAEGWSTQSETTIASGVLTIRQTVTLEVTGLTPGDVKGYKAAFRVSGAATTMSVFGGPTWGPLALEAWAAP